MLPVHVNAGSDLQAQRVTVLKAAQLAGQGHAGKPVAASIAILLMVGGRESDSEGVQPEGLRIFAIRVDDAYIGKVGPCLC